MTTPASLEHEEEAAVAVVDMQVIWVVLLQEESPSGKVAALLCQWQQEAVRQPGEQVLHQLEACPTLPNSLIQG